MGALYAQDPDPALAQVQVPVPRLGPVLAEDQGRGAGAEHIGEADLAAA